MNEDLRKKAFDFASDTTKQLITLSTALIALSVTFKGNFNSEGHEIYLLLCWVGLFISVLSGIGTLMALTGTLEKSTEEGENKIPLSIYGKNVKRPSLSQILSFLFGLLFLAIYGYHSIYSETNSKPTDEIEVIKRSTYKFAEPEKIDTVKIKE